MCNAHRCGNGLFVVHQKFVLRTWSAAGKLMLMRQVSKVDAKQQKEALLQATADGDDWAIARSPTQLRDDDDYVLETVMRNGMALHFASERLRTDRLTILAAVTSNGHAIRYAHPRFWSDRAIMAKACESSPASLAIAAPDLRDDGAFVRLCLAKDGNLLRTVPSHLRDDPETAFVAAQTTHGAVRWASARLLDDAGFMLRVLRVHGCALEWASDAIRGSKHHVIAAVQQDGSALRFASAELRNDSATVLEAVRQNAQALWHASNLLLRTPRFVLDAQKVNPQCSSTLRSAVGPVMDIRALLAFQEKDMKKVVVKTLKFKVPLQVQPSLETPVGPNLTALSDSRSRSLPVADAPSSIAQRHARPHTARPIPTGSHAPIVASGSDRPSSAKVYRAKTAVNRVPLWPKTAHG